MRPGDIVVEMAGPPGVTSRVNLTHLARVREALGMIEPPVQHALKEQLGASLRWIPCLTPPPNGRRRPFALFAPLVQVTRVTRLCSRCGRVAQDPYQWVSLERDRRAMAWLCQACHAEVPMPWARRVTHA